MRQAQQSPPGSTSAHPTATKRSSLPVIRTFVVLIVVVALLAGVAFVIGTQSARDPDPQTSSSGFCLTDDEALERFRKLQALRSQATRGVIQA